MRAPLSGRVGGSDAAIAASVRSCVDVLGPDHADARRVILRAIAAGFLAQHGGVPGPPRFSVPSDPRLERCEGLAQLVSRMITLGPSLLGKANELLVAIERREEGGRRSGGVVYTPESLASRVVSLALGGPGAGLAERHGHGLRVLDPSCGSGVFLLAAIDHLARSMGPDPDQARRLAAACVLGIDIDPVSVEVSRWIIAATCGESIGAFDEQIVVADALLGFPESHGSCDVVVGNPPFLCQLKAGTAASRERSAALRGAGLRGAHPYADESGMFLLRSIDSVHDGGRVSMIVPRSVLAAQGSSWMRTELSDRASLESVWFVPSGAFPHASVHVCVPTLVRGAPGAGSSAEVLVGEEPRVCARRVASHASGWSDLHADAMGVPDAAFESSGVLASIADASADFRDEYYALEGFIQDNPRSVARLMTSGLVDLAASRWGEKRARIHKQAWGSPSIELREDAPRKLIEWVEARACSKVLIATQTRHIEALADPHGIMLPVTPLISVYPHDPDELWMIGAAGASPVANMVAMRRAGGSALHPDAIKLSAKQVLALPVPEDVDAWRQAADRFREAHSATDESARIRLLEGMGASMNAAYRVPVGDAERLMSWWVSRLARR